MLCPINGSYLRGEVSHQERGLLTALGTLAKILLPSASHWFYIHSWFWPAFCPVLSLYGLHQLASSILQCLRTVWLSLTALPGKGLKR